MSNERRALKRLTLEPAHTFSLEADGFVGCLYEPERDEYPGKAVVMFGGSDGIYPLTRLTAEEYVKRGMTALALAYWGQPGLPDRFERVPVEPVERAALWLREHGYEKAGLWGISKGAELALIAGSLMPELVSCVTAVCPMSICCQGFQKKTGVKPLNCSSWSWQSQELPWAKLRFSKREILRDSLRERGVCLRSCYLDAIRNAPEAAQIQAERIAGPLLLIYPERDGMWPSELAVEKLYARLQRHGFSYPVKRLSYPYASHMLIPITSRSAAMFAVEREHPAECRASDMDAFEKTLAFWKEVW